MTVAVRKPNKENWYFPNLIYFSTLHLLALTAFIPQAFSWQGIALMLILHWITACLGVTVGFHRLASHRSFEVPKWLEYFLIFCGTLACEGGPIYWVGTHRMHHKFSDQPTDPHDSRRGFWWSHLGWLLHELEVGPDIPRYAKDVYNDRFYTFCEKNFIAIQVVFGLLLFTLGQFLGGLGLSFIVWGVFVRLIIVFHGTWFVNSATHKFGYQSYPSDDESRNCWWVALVTYGEGWHNNHHAFQYSARHGIAWWEVDITWMVIRTFQLLGLAKNVKLAPVLQQSSASQ